MGCSPSSSLDLLNTVTWRALLRILVALTISVLLLVGTLRGTATTTGGRVVREFREGGLASLLTPTPLHRIQEEDADEEQLQRRCVHKPFNVF